MSALQLFTKNVFCNESLTPEDQANSAEFRLFGSKWRFVTRLLGLPLGQERDDLVPEEVEEVGIDPLPNPRGLGVLMKG